MTDEEKKEIYSIIHKAVDELGDLTNKIFQSTRILKYQHNGQLILDIIYNILSTSVLNNIRGIAYSNKIVDNKTNKEFSREERFKINIEIFKNIFEDIEKQQIQLVEKDNGK